MGRRAGVRAEWVPPWQAAAGCSEGVIMADQQPAPQPGKSSKLQSGKKPVFCATGFTIIAVGIVFGVIFWGALNTGLEYTNRTEFCLSCHEMKIPYEDYKKGIHYTNRAGHQVSCSDCHVPTSKTPGDYTRKVVRKIEAARDVWGHLTGSIDTNEKFEAKRLAMAEREWARMKSHDSKECRNCHQFERMDPAKTKKRAVVKHEEAVEEKKTCIDCHKGIAHKPVHLKQGEEDPAKPATGVQG